MKEFFMLRILDRFKHVFKLFGIDYVNLRTILQVKLEMDQRRVPTVFANSNKEDGKEKIHF
ncbi:hypothetical protein [Bacillus sp. JCM 19034]|uniref:hypothetical protein n=1 Tax=Bacillus sp. JCM 19034 TaxID=1481928 RepID=UPI0009E7F748|nr:hypothetical protein [Bacillus sp. JCM 19034]